MEASLAKRIAQALADAENPSSDRGELSERLESLASEAEQGLGGSAHAPAHFFGIAYKAQRHYLLGEYDKVIETPSSRAFCQSKAHRLKYNLLCMTLLILQKRNWLMGNKDNRGGYGTHIRLV